MKNLLILLLILPFTSFSQYTMNAVKGKSGKGVSKYNELQTNPKFLLDAPETAKVWIGGYQVEISKQENFTQVLTPSGKVRLKDIVLDYRGKVSGDPASIVALTFSKKEVSGLIITQGQTLVIGNVDSTTIIYNEKDLYEKNSFTCNTQEPSKSTNTGKTGTQSTLLNFPIQNVVAGAASIAGVSTKCVNIYLETDYNIFQNKGSVANVEAYVRAVFNQVATLYANDGITIKLKTLFVWDVPDPYTGPSSGNYLTQFKDYRVPLGYDGDLAHLLSFAGSSGVAYVNGISMCNYGFYKGGPYGQSGATTGYSGITQVFSNVPTYSWTVSCLAHEIGHQLGSDHTHACVWNGNNTRIDSCGDYAGYNGCITPALDRTQIKLPVGGGTIMSYCHLTSVGINLSKGFGPQVRDRMQGFINGAICLQSCTDTCTLPAQPSLITGPTGGCYGQKLTLSVTPVSNTSYVWTLPPTWTGTSSTNSITVTVGTQNGPLSVQAVNSCGISFKRTIDANATNCNPCYPKSEIGSKPCPQGQTGSINYTLSYTCVNGVLTPGDTIWTWNCTTIAKDSVKINCTLQEVLFSTGLSKYVKVFPQGATNYKYSWYKNGVLQVWKTQIIYSNNYTQYKRGDVLKVIVGSTNATYNGKPIKPGEAVITIK